MNQFKRMQVTMLPTEDITSFYKWGARLYHNCLKKSHVNTKSDSQHLYITSDDEIKQDDFILTFTHAYGWNIERIKEVRGTTYVSVRNEQLLKESIKGKIIATTDTPLRSFEGIVCTYLDFSLPQPSPQFIEKFIEEYNKGNVIKDVLVEYEQDYTNRNCGTCNLGTDGTCELKLEKKCCSNTNNDIKHADYWISCLDEEEDSEIYKIKINPKDNTITIKKLKDTWNREEVVGQMWLAYKAANTLFEDESALRIEFNNWINLNL
jgi:hypothetical protein